MGFIKNIFRPSQLDSPPAGDFQDSDPGEPSSRGRSLVRRERVHTALAETMRKHGIPSDWIACKVLSVVTSQKKAGLHVMFIVARNDADLLPFVHTFQETFWREMDRLEPTARGWIFSLSWQFSGAKPAAVAARPAARPAAEPKRPPGFEDDTLPLMSGAGPMTAGTLPDEEDAEDLESDLQALYAIRDASIAAPLDAPPAPKRPGPAR